MPTPPPPLSICNDDEVYFIGKSPQGVTLYIGPVTAAQLEEAGISGTSTGYYLCELDADDPAASTNVLAAFSSTDAAYRFAEIIGLFRTDRPIYSFEEPLELTGQ